MNQQKRIGTLIAFRMMQSVYAPLIKFRKEMVKNDCTHYIDMIDKFVVDARENCFNRNIQFFIDMGFSYTINGVCKSIVELYNSCLSIKDAYFDSLICIFDSLKKDFNK